MRDIETIRNTHTLMQELKKQNLSFNLNEFYANVGKESCHSGAIQIITPEHSVAFFADRSHMLAVKNVYRLLDKNFTNFTSEIWQDDCTNRGNILFQFCANSFSLAWFPSKITPFQLKKTMCNCILVNEINAKAISGQIKLPDSFFKHVEANGEERYITVETNILADENSVLTLNDAMPKIKRRVILPKNKTFHD